MPTTLALLRHNAPKLHPIRVLAWHAGCWIQYYDDTGAKNPAKALSTPAFSLAVARHKQMERCAIGFSLQAFEGKRTKETITEFRNLGVDVDLIPPDERRTLPPPEFDRHKEAYLAGCLRQFPLRPHWLTETRHGFHLMFRLRPLTDAAGIRAAEAVQRRLVAALRGDPNAVLLTQLLRVPGTLQFKHPRQPFLCRLLLDNAATIEPYSLDAIRRLLNAQGPGVTDGASGHELPQDAATSWRAGLPGVVQGQRNAMAATIAGSILCRLPEELWETAGWGGLKEWNLRNAVPLTNRELRNVFVSIARREQSKRQKEVGDPEEPRSFSAER